MKYTINKIGEIQDYEVPCDCITCVLPIVFMGKPVYIAAVYLSGTEEPLPCLGALSIKALEFKVSRLT